MLLNSILFLDSQIQLPFRFTALLPFSEEDKLNMSWLSKLTRYYAIEKEIGQGGRATAFKGVVSDEYGEAIPGSPQIVLKVPNLTIDDYTSSQIKEYLSRQRDEGGREWQLTRKRLFGCEYANPIFDFSVVIEVDYLGELMPLPVSAQRFLHDATSLDEYLLNTKQRAEPFKSKKGVPIDNWNGMADPKKWIELARGIAIGLADIHQRRVVHGDVWPPNIFIKLDKNGNPRPIFIDFGESFPIEPQGNPKEQRDHAYRAPERKDVQSIVTQQADVYSFGKLILHLAIGEEPILSSKYRGHLRREVIREKFKNRNPYIASENPFIIDIICKCVSLDPVKRPSMSDVLRALNTYVDTESYSTVMSKVSDRILHLKETWNVITDELAIRNTSVGPFLEELVDQRLDEIQWMMKGLSNDVINLIDTRERLILGLVSLFQRLGKGDRFLSITTPRMWQGTALGLNGRYFTATELATVRGASIQRAFIVSIQELGEEWATKFSQNLEKLGKTTYNPTASKLSILLNLEINKYLAAKHQGEAPALPNDVQKEAQERLGLVIKSYLDASKELCANKFDKSDYKLSINCEGIYLGLIPVSTLSAMRTLKAAYPVSVFYYSNAKASDQYLLMMTDCLGRNSYRDDVENTSDDIAFLKSKPELRGITVFKSVLGIPEDRIKKLEQIFKQSINIGGWLEELYDELPT
jgi:serine/threonine protein kinase